MTRKCSLVFEGEYEQDYSAVVSKGSRSNQGLLAS
jgi:hypothetical protein